MDLDRNPIAIGYQTGAILGLLLGGFLADTWLWFAVVVSSTAVGGTLAGWVVKSIMTRLIHHRSQA